MLTTRILLCRPAIQIRVWTNLNISKIGRPKIISSWTVRKPKKSSFERINVLVTTFSSHHHVRTLKESLAWLHSESSSMIDWQPLITSAVCWSRVHGCCMHCAFCETTVCRHRQCMTYSDLPCLPSCSTVHLSGLASAQQLTETDWMHSYVDARDCATVMTLCRPLLTC